MRWGQGDGSHWVDDFVCAFSSASRPASHARARSPRQALRLYVRIAGSVFSSAQRHGHFSSAAPQCDVAVLASISSSLHRHQTICHGTQCAVFSSAGSAQVLAIQGARARALAFVYQLLTCALVMAPIYVASICFVHTARLGLIPEHHDASAAPGD